MSNARIDAAVVLTSQKLASHFAGLIQERSSGSKWGEVPGLKLFTLDWQEFTPAPGAAIPGCTYYCASITQEFPDATLGACSLDALKDEQLAQVQVVRGRHGLELQGPAVRVVTGSATLILGNEEGIGEVVFTVHPGEPLAPLGNPAVKLG